MDIRRNHRPKKSPDSKHLFGGPTYKKDEGVEKDVNPRSLKTADIDGASPQKFLRKPYRQLDSIINVNKDRVTDIMSQLGDLGSVHHLTMKNRAHKKTPDKIKV